MRGEISVGLRAGVACDDDHRCCCIPPGVTATSIAAGAYHTCALVTGGVVKCWGQNSDGQLGTGNTSPQTSPVVVNLGTGTREPNSSFALACHLGFTQLRVLALTEIVNTSMELGA